MSVVSFDVGRFEAGFSTAAGVLADVVVGHRLESVPLKPTTSCDNRGRCPWWGRVNG